MPRVPDGFPHSYSSLVGLVLVGRMIPGNWFALDITAGVKSRGVIQLASSKENEQILLTKGRLFDTFEKRMKHLGLKREKI